MKEFFGIGGFQREPEGAWSWQHILFVSLMLAAMIALAIFLGIKNRNKDLAVKNKVLIWVAILIDGFELIKIFVTCYADGIESLRRLLPLFLCSIQLITIPLAAFSKGRMKEASLDFVLLFGILGSVFGTIGATQNYNAYPVLSMPNVVSAITHCISGFASLYIIISGMQSMKKNNIIITIAILLGFSFAALMANWAFDYNYMFLKSHDGTPYVLLWNLVGGIPFLYSTGVIAIFIIYIAIFYYIYFMLQRKSFAKAAEAKVAAANAPTEPQNDE